MSNQSEQRKDKKKAVRWAAELGPRTPDDFPALPRPPKDDDRELEGNEHPLSASTLLTRAAAPVGSNSHQRTPSASAPAPAPRTTDAVTPNRFSVTLPSQPAAPRYPSTPRVSANISLKYGSAHEPVPPKPSTSSSTSSSSTIFSQPTPASSSSTMFSQSTPASSSSTILSQPTPTSSSSTMFSQPTPVHVTSSSGSYITYRSTFLHPADIIAANPKYVPASGSSHHPPPSLPPASKPYHQAYSAPHMQASSSTSKLHQRTPSADHAPGTEREIAHRAAGYVSASNPVRPQPHPRRPSDPGTLSQRDAVKAGYVPARMSAQPERPQYDSRHPSDPVSTQLRLETYHASSSHQRMEPPLVRSHPTRTAPQEISPTRMRAAQEPSPSPTRARTQYVPVYTGPAHPSEAEEPTSARRSKYVPVYEGPVSPTEPDSPTKHPAGYVPVYTGPVPSSDTEGGTRSRARAYSTGTNYQSDSGSRGLQRLAPLKQQLSPASRAPPGPGTAIYLDPKSSVYHGLCNQAFYAIQYELNPLTAGDMYTSGEHLYQALKFFPHTRRMQSVRHAERPLEKALELQEYVRADWAQVRMRAMEEVLTLKFKQHRALRADLLSTGKASLVYVVADRFWGIGSNEDGRNEYGNMLMALREQYRRTGID